LTEGDAQNLDFALYVGESREVQKTLVAAVGDLRMDLKEFRTEVKQDFGGLKDMVGEHGSRIAVLETDQKNMKDELARQSTTIAPIRLHPIVVTGIILSPILSVAAIVTTTIIATAQ